MGAYLSSICMGGFVPISCVWSIIYKRSDGDHGGVVLWFLVVFTSELMCYAGCNFTNLAPSLELFLDGRSSHHDLGLHTVQAGICSAPKAEVVDGGSQ